MSKFPYGQAAFVNLKKGATMSILLGLLLLAGAIFVLLNGQTFMGIFGLGLSAMLLLMGLPFLWLKREALELRLDEQGIHTKGWELTWGSVEKAEFVQQPLEAASRKFLTHHMVIVLSEKNTKVKRALAGRWENFDEVIRQVREHLSTTGAVIEEKDPSKAGK